MAKGCIIYQQRPHGITTYDIGCAIDQIGFANDKLANFLFLAKLDFAKLFFGGKSFPWLARLNTGYASGIDFL